MLAWDTCALSALLRRPEGPWVLLSAALSDRLKIPAIVITELAAGRPSKDEEDFLEALLSNNEPVLLTTPKESLEAGRWTRGLARSGSKNARKDQHIRHVLDGTIASTAWHRGLTVVTENTDHFELFRHQHPQARILTLDEALAILASTLP